LQFSAVQLASATELQHTMWLQLRRALYTALHSTTTPLSTLLPPLRQLMLLLCTSAPAASAQAAAASSANIAVVPMDVDHKGSAAAATAATVVVKLESRPPSISPQLDGRKGCSRTRSETASSNSGNSSIDDDQRKHQLLKLCLQVLLFCCSQDPDVHSCGEQVYLDLVQPPAAAANSSAGGHKSLELLTADEERSLWEWGPPTGMTAPPPQALPHVAAPTDSAEQKLDEALSFTSLL